MSVTILEALENAEVNLVKNHQHPTCRMLGAEQLHNAIVLLDKGYGPFEIFDDVMGDREKVEDVPDKESK